MKKIKKKTYPVGRTNIYKKPNSTGLAVGLTQQAIKVFELAKKQQKEQAKVDEENIK